MTGQEKTYTNTLSDGSRTKVYRKKHKGTILRFSIQYEALINGRWRKIMRYDNAHGQPHRHTFYPDGSEYRQEMSANTSNDAFTQADIFVKKNFKQMREQYILLLDNHGGRHD